MMAFDSSKLPSHSLYGPEAASITLLSSFGPKLLFVFAVTFFGISLPTGDDEIDMAESSLPQRITHMGQASDVSASPFSQVPSLRGAGGAPTEFHWVFLDAANNATAGIPFRTRVFAMDSSGRQARPSECSTLRVDIGLQGHARLLGTTASQLAWQNGELHVDIVNDIAETIEAEVRIASPLAEADRLLSTSSIRFISGPVHTYVLHVSYMDPATTISQGTHATHALRLPTKAKLDVFVSSRDRYGNPSTLQRANKCLLLSSNSESSELGLGSSTSGNLGSLRVCLDQKGEGRAWLRIAEAGLVELWLEPSGGSIEDRRSLRNSSLRRLNMFKVSSTGERSALTSTESDGSSLSLADSAFQPLAEEVRSAFLHAWRSYRQHAWGRDELKPLSKSGSDTFGGVGMTILDSLTTLWIMGLWEEFDAAADFVERLSFDHANLSVSVFELTIRGLGGLLGAHSLSGRPVFLERARDLATLLLPAFNSSSGLPWPKCNLARGTCDESSEPTILAEAGSLQLEWRYLAAHTGDQRFKDVADRAFDAIQNAGVPGVMPVFLSPPGHAPARVLTSKFAIGALSDSYYEYLLKQWLQSPSEVHFKERWLVAMDELAALVRPQPKAGKLSEAYKTVEILPGGGISWKMDHLSCYAPGMLALGLRSLPAEDLAEKARNRTFSSLAIGLTESCVELWTSTKSGLASECRFMLKEPPHRFSGVPSDGKHSFLRPETAESLFYLHRFKFSPEDPERFRRSGEKMFRAIVDNARVDAGFASVEDVSVVPTKKIDEMQSFVMAETFKYLYLLFMPDKALDLDRFVLNTEAHPLLKL